jgi:hypothetical protein
LGELLTTCVAIALELVPRSSSSFCEHIEVETLNETCQSRASSDHLPHEPQASMPRADHFSVGQGFDETVNPMTAGSFAPFTA